MKKKNGYTLIEILIAIAIFTIIVIAAMVNIPYSNRIAELRTATDNLADDLKYLQTLSLGNIKINEYPDIERGYSYYFTQNQYTYNWYEITAPDEISTNFTYNSLGTKNYYSPKIKLIEVVTNSNLSFFDKKPLGIETAYAACPSCAPGCPCSEKIKRTNFLFPEATGQIIDVFPNSGYCTGPCTNLILYLKHDNISNKQGKVTYSALSGRVMSEIVNYP